MAFHDPESLISIYKGILPPLKSNAIPITTFQLNLQNSQPIIHEKKLNSANRGFLQYSQRYNLALLGFDDRRPKPVQNDNLGITVEKNSSQKKEEALEYQYKTPEKSPLIRAAISNQQNIEDFNRKHRERSLAFILKETQLKPLKVRSKSVPRLQPLENYPNFPKNDMYNHSRPISPKLSNADHPSKNASQMTTRTIQGTLPSTILIHQDLRRNSNRLNKLTPLIFAPKISEPNDQFLKPSKDTKSQLTSNNPSPREFLEPHLLESLPHGTFFSMELTPRKIDSRYKSRYIQLDKIKENPTMMTGNSKLKKLNSKPSILDLLLNSKKVSADHNPDSNSPSGSVRKRERYRRRVEFVEQYESLNDKKADGTGLSQKQRRIGRVEFQIASKLNFPEDSQEEGVEAELLDSEALEQKIEESAKLAEVIKENAKKTEPPVHPLIIKITHGKRSPYDPSRRPRKKKSLELEPEPASEKAISPAMEDFRRKLFEVVKKLKKLKLTISEIIKHKVFSLRPFEKAQSQEFMFAVKAGNEYAVNRLLQENKYLVYDFDHLHLTALHWATKLSYPQIMESLIEKGADLHAKDIIGRTPLYFAIINDDVSCLRELILGKVEPWSTEEINYTRLLDDRPYAKYFLSKCRQIHILLMMTPLRLQDAVWEKESIVLFNNEARRAKRHAHDEN